MNTGNNLLFLIVAAQLGFMAVSGLMGWLNIRHLHLEVAFPDEIYSGIETIVTLRVRSLRRHLPSFLIRAHLFDQTTQFPVVDRGASASIPIMVTFRGRGEKTVEKCRFSSIFPVNFFIRFAHCPLDRPFIVFPEPRKSPIPARAGTGKEGEAAVAARGYDGDVEKIADYTGTEPRKLIHWRLSAKHEQFKVKEMAARAAEPVILDVAAVAGANLEERLSRAAYLVNRLLREKRPVGMKLGGRRIPPATGRTHRLHLLRELALYDPY